MGEKREVVTAEPEFGANGLVRFRVNVNPGEVLELHRIPHGNKDMELPRLVTVLSQTDFTILVDAGQYRLGITKASIFSRYDMEDEESRHTLLYYTEW